MRERACVCVYACAIALGIEMSVLSLLLLQVEAPTIETVHTPNDMFQQSGSVTYGPW